MNNLVTRYAKGMDSYVKYVQQQKNLQANQAKTSTNASAKNTALFAAENQNHNQNRIDDTEETLNNIGISKEAQKELEKVIKQCQKFSNPIMGMLHYIKNVILFIPLGSFRYVMSFHADKHGGSSSSFFRDANTKRNAFLCAKYLASTDNLSPEDIQSNYNNLKNNGKPIAEKVIYEVDLNNNKIKDENGQPREYKGKCVYETTEIAIYRTKSGDVFGIPKGPFWHKSKEAVMLFNHAKDNFHTFQTHNDKFARIIQEEGRGQERKAAQEILFEILSTNANSIINRYNKPEKESDKQRYVISENLDNFKNDADIRNKDTWSSLQKSKLDIALKKASQNEVLTLQDVAFLALSFQGTKSHHAMFRGNLMESKFGFSSINPSRMLDQAGETPYTVITKIDPTENLVHCKFTYDLLEVDKNLNKTKIGSIIYEDVFKFNIENQQSQAFSLELISSKPMVQLDSKYKLPSNLSIEAKVKLATDKGNFR